MARTTSPKTAPAGAGRTQRLVQAESLRRWVVRARQRGLAGPELVFRLHVRRRMPLRQVAQVLGLHLGEVRDHWRQHCVARAALAPEPDRVLPPLAPKSKAEVAALRAHVTVALWETVVATFPAVKLADEKAGTYGPAPGPLEVKPSMLLVRLKALRRLGRMSGLGGKGGDRAAAAAPVSYATPEEIAAAVRAWMGRKDEG